MMIIGEVLNFVAYSFVEGSCVRVPFPLLSRPHRGFSTAIVVVSIQRFNWPVPSNEAVILGRPP
jgi:hypothetical protein